MPKISELTDITTLAVGDKIPVLDVSDTGTPNPAGTVKYTTPAEIKTSVLGAGVDIGTDGTGNIVTTSGIQTLTDKRLAAPGIKGATVTGTVTVANGCTMTTPVLTSPDINGGTIDGATIDDTTTVEIDAGAVACSTLVDKTSTQTLSGKTMTTPVIASLYQDADKTYLVTMPAKTDTLVGKTTTDVLANKTLTIPVIASLRAVDNGGIISIPASAGTDTVVLADAEQTLTAKTLTTPTITTPVIAGGTMTGVAIDSTSTLNSKTITAIFAEKADVVTAAQSCTLKLANGVGTTDTVTLAEILAAAGIGAGYAVLATSVTATLYVDDTTFNYVPITQSGGVTIKITKDTGSGVAATLKEIGIAGLSGGEEYYLALGFKLVASS